MLDALLGIDTRGYVRLQVGPHTVVGAFEARRDFERHEVALVVDHPNEHARTVLSPETARSLGADLA